MNIENWGMMFLEECRNTRRKICPCVIVHHD